MSNLTCPHCDSSTYTKRGSKITRNGRVQRYKCKSCRRTFAEEYIYPPINISDQIFCPSCSSNDVKGHGSYHCSDGKKIQRYQCKPCGRQFPSDYVRVPAQPADENCPKCDSRNTVKTGSPLIRNGYTTQPCFCKDCSKKFSLGTRKRLEIVLNG